MSKKLYVGNLNYGTTEDELAALFSTAGAVTSVAIITDRMTGRSRGFGFVEMENDAEAMQAIQEFNGREFANRTLTVAEARPQAERRSNDRGDRGRRGRRDGWY
ncbi:MAG: RNA-binding protein [Anaerolineae bacterium]